LKTNQSEYNLLIRAHPQFPVLGSRAHHCLLEQDGKQNSAAEKIYL